MISDTSLLNCWTFGVKTTFLMGKDHDLCHNVMVYAQMHFIQKRSQYNVIRVSI